MDESKEKHFDGKIALKAIIENQGRVLLVRDPREGEKIWEIPGGRMNEGEEPEAALAREIKEELGIDIVVEEVVHMQQFYQFSEERNAFLITFAAKFVEANADLVLAEDEIAEIWWATKEEALATRLYEEYGVSLKKYFKSGL